MRFSKPETVVVWTLTNVEQMLIFAGRAKQVPRWVLAKILREAISVSANGVTN